MDFKVKCTEVPNKEDYYDLEISTYKEKINGRFERSEIRHMIGILDNSINVGENA
jgi:hypothetical protein